MDITNLQCMDCGHEGWSQHELKDGLCPFCREDEEMEDQNHLDSMYEIYLCPHCLAMFEQECFCFNDEDE